MRAEGLFEAQGHRARGDAAATVVLADAVAEVGAEEVRAPDVGEVDAADGDLLALRHAFSRAG